MSGWMAKIPWIARWRSRRDAALCMATKERIQQIVDGELPRSAANDRLFQHLDACVRCGDEARAVQELKRTVRDVLERSGRDLTRRIEAIAREVAESARDPEDGR